MDKLKKEFASKLLKVKAIKLQPNDPFTWASGWKSPFYCDNRKTLSFPELRNYVKLELVHAILEQFPEADAVAGVATGAIAQGALVADELNMPFVYVRSKPKDHGMQNLIEGQLDPKAKVVALLAGKGECLLALYGLDDGGSIVLCLELALEVNIQRASVLDVRHGIALVVVVSADIYHQSLTVLASSPPISGKIGFTISLCHSSLG